MMCSCLLVHVRNLLTLTLLNYICVFLLNHSIQSQYWERKCLGWKRDSRKKQGLWGVRLVSPSFLFWVVCRPGDPPQVMCCVRLTQASREDLVPFKCMVFPRRSVTLRLLMQDTSTNPQTLTSHSDAVAPWKGARRVFKWRESHFPKHYMCRSSCCTPEKALPSQAGVLSSEGMLASFPVRCSKAAGCSKLSQLLL